MKHRSKRELNTPLGRAHLPWPLTSAAYNRNYLDQTHTARKTLLTRQSQTTHLRYPSQRQPPHLRPYRQRQGRLSQSQMILQQKTSRLADLIVIDFVKDWVRLTKPLSSIALIKTARRRDIGSDGALICPIDNGSFLTFSSQNTRIHHLPRLQLGKTIRGTATHGHISPMSTLAHGRIDGEKTASQVLAITTSVSASPSLCGTKMTGCSKSGSLACQGPKGTTGRT